MRIVAVRAGAFELSGAVCPRRKVLPSVATSTEFSRRKKQKAGMIGFVIVVAGHAVIEIRRAVQELRIGHQLRVTTRKTQPALRRLEDASFIPLVTRLAIPIAVGGVNVGLLLIGFRKGGDREKTSQQDA